MLKDSDLMTNEEFALRFIEDAGVIEHDELLYRMYIINGMKDEFNAQLLTKLTKERKMVKIEFRTPKVTLVYYAPKDTLINYTDS